MDNQRSRVFKANFFVEKAQANRLQDKVISTKKGESKSRASKLIYHEGRETD
jgi:hypothetical protein